MDQLKAVKPTNFRGRRQRTGTLTRMPDGRLGAFVGYCPNDHCRSKICMEFETAKGFARSFSKDKRKLINRILLKLLSRLELQTR